MSSKTLTYVKIFLEFMQITVKECLTGDYSLYNDTQQHNYRGYKMQTFKAILLKSVCAPSFKPERVIIKLGACSSITRACKVANEKCPCDYMVYDVSVA